MNRFIEIFGFKKSFKLKTKYRTTSECLENCRDLMYKTHRLISYSSLINGEINLQEKTFELSSVGGFAQNVVFCGSVENEKGYVLMNGYIKPKLINLILFFGFKITAIYIAVDGIKFMYINRLNIESLYSSLLILMFPVTLIYFTPKLLFNMSSQFFIDSIEKKVK